MSSEISNAAIAMELQRRLPAIGRELIAATQDLSRPDNQQFYQHPDDPLMHKPEWHQWGIITHTQKFADYHQAETPGYLRAWGIYDAIQHYMADEVEGVAKSALFILAIWLHDLGKFTKRTQRRRRDGSTTFNFIDHEQDSGRIIRTQLSEDLADYGLSGRQVEYIARCAELHYELGVVRNEAKLRGAFTVEFARSHQTRDVYRQLHAQHPLYAVEIGLLYLGDSLAKVELHPKADATLRTTPEVAAELTQRHLRPELIHSARQLPTNLAVARAYLLTYFSA